MAMSEKIARLLGRKEYQLCVMLADIITKLSDLDGDVDDLAAYARTVTEQLALAEAQKNKIEESGCLTSVCDQFKGFDLSQPHTSYRVDKYLGFDD